MCSLEKRGNLFILTLTGQGVEHRLNPDLISSIIAALSQAKAQSTRGSALVTVSHGKFFCNGLDLDWVSAVATSNQEAQQHFDHLYDSLKQLVLAFISLPMPTVAAVNGHVAAAGVVLALCHDYVIMRRDRGVLYMSELDKGIGIPEVFMALFRAKISGSTRRDMLLRGLKIKGEEALKMGIVEAIYDGEEGATNAGTEMGNDLAKRNWDGEVYVEIRKGLYHELCGMLRMASNVIATPKL
ncbi:3-hydroxyacyl-CoA dehydratase 1, ARABIDOPSIS THALIANA DELTA(3), DELTA(2)-ENOYL COA ISOMERASE 3 [Hibiscus trionum]|uniref:Delta(3)-Delta(2)-enoyl-CoA isomerase n=1 Tax=Hibiscus trionum TaxID=183268 RepID=A0A9W7ISR8_HIBTR|nr:3-hydroxyacyl-CoA dehydratase 1, ARABIDOPSIS THALIANA DELTA(3), DELTA(2)-ENOYL COA ISOMERASE 3 [Hibiscus trionum]